MDIQEKILQQLSEIKSILKDKSNVVVQKPVKTFWQPYTYTNNQTRVFYCNAVVFNNQGTSKVFINNVFLLDVGDSLSLECDQNEIDFTEYSISFEIGGTNKLGVMVKANEGVRALISKYESTLVAPIDRRKQVKEYTKRRRRGTF